MPFLNRLRRCQFRSSWLLMLGLLVLLGLRAPVQAELSREARIQTVLVMRLMKFVEWPGDKAAASEPMNICTWGDSATATALQSLQGQSVREREIRVRKLTPGVALDTRGCQVLFVADSVREVTPALLYGSGNPALLTISDMPEFNRRGGMVSLIRQDNRVSFDIHLRYARDNGLQIGAPLLQLARSVE